MTPTPRIWGRGWRGNRRYRTTRIPKWEGEKLFRYPVRLNFGVISGEFLDLKRRKLLACNFVLSLMFRVCMCFWTQHHHHYTELFECFLGLHTPTYHQAPSTSTFHWEFITSVMLSTHIQLYAWRRRCKHCVLEVALSCVGALNFGFAYQYVHIPHAKRKFIFIALGSV